MASRPIEHDVVQGSDEWIAARCGLLTASEMKLILTPAKLKAAANDKERVHLYELLAQRITGYVEPSYISEDMLRGYDDEVTARELYAKRFAPVREVGFITNDAWGFTLGYSPDGLVGDDGLIEVKSRRQGLHVRTIIEDVAEDNIPSEHMLQVQTGLLVSDRSWCDVISYSAGMPMTVVRTYALQEVQQAIIEAAEAFEARLEHAHARYAAAIKAARTQPTERIEHEIAV